MQTFGARSTACALAPVRSSSSALTAPDEDEKQPKRRKVSGAGAGARSHVVDSSDDNA